MVDKPPTLFLNPFQIKFLHFPKKESRKNILYYLYFLISTYIIVINHTKAYFYKYEVMFFGAICIFDKLESIEHAQTITRVILTYIFIL